MSHGPEQSNPRGGGQGGKKKRWRRRGGETDRGKEEGGGGGGGTPTMLSGRKVANSHSFWMLPLFQLREDTGFI